MHNERTTMLISAHHCHLKKLEKESYNSLTLTAAENKITTQLTSLLNMRRIANKTKTKQIIKKKVRGSMSIAMDYGVMSWGEGRDL